jgi:YVTN family beta-propeller protein
MGSSTDVLSRRAGFRAIAAFVAMLAAGCSSDSSQPNGPDGPAGGSGDRLYVTSGFTDEVLRIDPSDGALLSRIPTERRRDEVDEPHAVAISRDGLHWYVSVAHGEPTLWKYEMAGDRLVGRVTLPTAGAARIGITPDGARAFVPDYDRSQPTVASRVAVVDLTDMSVLAAPIVCNGPHHAEVDPTGALVAVACSLSDEIVLLDAGTLEERGRFAAGPEAGPPGQPALKPLNVAWSADGEVIWVGLHLAGTVRAFRPSGEIIGTVVVGNRPAQISLTPDGGTLVVANRGDASLSVVDTGLLIETARIPLAADHPHGLALDGTGQRAFVSCEGTTQTSGRAIAVDLEAGSILWSVEAGAYTLGAAYASGEPE